MTLAPSAQKSNPIIGVFVSISLVLGVLALAFYIGREMLIANAQTTDCVIDAGDRFVPCPEENLKPMGQLDAEARLERLTEPHGVDP